MKFKRIEVRRMVRYVEDIVKHDEIAQIMTTLYEKNITFTMDCKMGVVLEKCRVLTPAEDSVLIISRKPNMLKKNVDFDSIVSLELESNSDVTDIDGNDRWSFL
jgi:hypothetical protein